LAVQVESDRCEGCGSCVDVCPENALEIINGKVVINEDRCAECGACTEVCPNEALGLRRRVRQASRPRPS